MEQQIDTRTWQEKLNDLPVGGREPVDKEQSVYSAIRNHFENSEKEFSIRTDRNSKATPKGKFVIRMK